MPETLRLKAADAEDLAVIAAILQDALVMVDDMTYLAEDRRFVMVVNRFIWEQKPGGPVASSRTSAAVTFDRVTAVTRRNLDRRQGEQILSLLTIQPASDGLRLTFSDDIAIGLAADAIELHLQDLGEPWPTLWRPRHEAP